MSKRRGRRRDKRRKVRYIETAEVKIKKDVEEWRKYYAEIAKGEEESSREDEKQIYKYQISKKQKSTHYIINLSIFLVYGKHVLTCAVA